MQQNQQRPIVLISDIFPNLAAGLQELAEMIRANAEDLSEPLSKIASASYVATPNGFYLYSTGKLTLREVPQTSI